MVDRDVIIRRMTLLEEYLLDLTELRSSISLEQFRQDKVLRRYAERTLHMAIEACIDIAHHIIAYEGYREPVSYQDSFTVLAEQGVLPEELQVRLEKMAQFRNVLVYDYVRVDPNIVFTIVQKHLADIADYVAIIDERFLQ